MSPEPPAPARPRLDSVDLLRGLVMALMALDHVRDYFTDVSFAPTDLSQTSAPLFFTRWITHFCAPVFVFLAGVGASLSRSRGKSTPDLSRFLISRGIWLVVLELTVVNLSWTFDLHFGSGFPFLVIWALGVSMIALGGLVYLPTRTVAAIGLLMIAGHNLLDGFDAAALRRFGPIWALLHIQHRFTLGEYPLFVGYPLIPWVGVMAAGYAFGPILTGDARTRRRRLLTLGGSLTALFIILRAANLYGDPSPWSPQRSGLFSLLSFIRTTKYPPSLLYLLMTLGPAIASLAWFDRAGGAIARFFVTIGRVPLFYYLLHIPLIHALSVAFGAAQGFGARPFLRLFRAYPADFGFGLPIVYVVWIGVVLALYPACRWFAALKQRRRSAWLSYL